ncbi:MAG: type II toxin-antitoxin system RelE/ParE family toxin [Chloroflexi bacterium]|nr:type II toxin-antitoxin system RelE/ParE family toxin [Chloroflexota bacterium]
MQKLQPNIAARVWTRIKRLSEEPVPSGATKLTGSANDYRLRVGAYRILYGVDHRAAMVIVFRIAHRREAYR